MKSFRIRKTSFAALAQRRHVMALIVMGALAIWGVSAFLRHSHTSFGFRHWPVPGAMGVYSFHTEHRSYENLTEDSTTSALELHLQFFKHFYILNIGTRSHW